MIINILDETEKLSYNLEEIIRNIINLSADTLGLDAKCSVDVLITDSENMREINKNTRNIDSVTDVLSFPMIDCKKESIADMKGLFLGDIVICFEKIGLQATEYGHSCERETGFLTTHAMLHLLGYDHIDEKQENIMIQTQNIILEKMRLYR